MLLERADKLDNASDAGWIWEETLKAFSEIGLSHVIYILSNADRSQVDLRTNMPDIYAGSDPARDPFLDYCCTSYEATRTGISYLPGYGYLPKGAKAFIQAAGRIGFRSGFGVPTRLAGSTRYGGFNIGADLSNEDFEIRFTNRLPEIRSFCLLVHRRLEELRRPAAQAAGLSRREREVLEHICSGASRKECANLLDLSPNTVAEYTKSAYKKLGVRNRAEARTLLYG